ncbi:hypothetical protein I79_026143 [Cricetulus griseus]|uniref:Uncharacterized protein n=1 Tax=Cricetulus griseus TaxID=10029 RepID=G3IQ52_CRIGR|nr:hypothetical protein I79_026143 [Cricetulus griseus]
MGHALWELAHGYRQSSSLSGQAGTVACVGLAASRVSGTPESRAYLVAVASIGTGVSSQPLTAKLGSRVGVYSWHEKHALAASVRAVRAALPFKKSNASAPGRVFVGSVLTGYLKVS